LAGRQGTAQGKSGGVMAEQPDKIEEALKEIWCCNDVRVKVAQGKIVAILAQTVQRPERAGITTTHTIGGDIVR
jgi:hypothetical protein